MSLLACRQHRLPFLDDEGRPRADLEVVVCPAGGQLKSRAHRTEKLVLCEGHGFRVGDWLLVENAFPPQIRQVMKVDLGNRLQVEVDKWIRASADTLLVNLGRPTDRDTWWDGSPVRIHRRTDGSDNAVNDATLTGDDLVDGSYRYWTRNRRVWELIVDPNHHVLQVIPDVFATTEVEGVFNVVDYGAVGDGEADDTAAIQEALEAAKDYRGAASERRGGVAYLPAGLYKVTESIVCPSDVTLRGEGRRVSQMRGDFAGPVISTRHVEHNPEGGRNAYVAIERLGLHNDAGGEDRVPRPGSIGIRLAQTLCGRISDVMVMYADCGILVSGVCYNSVLERVEVAHCPHAIVVTDQANDTRLQDSKVSNCRVGVALWGGAHYGLTNIWVTSVVVEGAREVGFQVGGGSNHLVSDTTLIGCRAERWPSADGIRVEDNAVGTVVISSFMGDVGCRIRDAGTDTLVLREGGQRTPLVLWEQGQTRGGKGTFRGAAAGDVDPGSFSFRNRGDTDWQDIKCARVRYRGGFEVETTTLQGAWFGLREADQGRPAWLSHEGNETRGRITVETPGDPGDPFEGGQAEVRVRFEREQLVDGQTPLVATVSRNDASLPQAPLTWAWEGSQTLVLTLHAPTRPDAAYVFCYAVSH